MATKTKAKPMRVFMGPAQLGFLIGAIAIVALLFGGYVVTTLPTAGELPTVQGAGVDDHPQQPNSIEPETNKWRSNAADAARYSGLAAFYSNKWRSNAADTARYSGLAAFYSANETAGDVTSQPVILGEAANSTVMAANPELAIASRYAARADWHRRHFPGR